jgi:hypothetical protein
VRLGWSSVRAAARTLLQHARTHTIIHTHTHKDSSERVISSSQTSLSAQNTRNIKDEHPCLHRVSNPGPSNQATSDLHLKPNGHRVRQICMYFPALKEMQTTRTS